MLNLQIRFKENALALFSLKLGSAGLACILINSVHTDRGPLGLWPTGLYPVHTELIKIQVMLARPQLETS